MGTNMDEYEKMLQDVSDMEVDEEKALKKIKKQIDQRITHIAVRVVLFFVLAALVVIPIAELMAWSNYGNAVRLEKQEITDEMGSRNGLTRYMRTYFGTFVPYLEVYDARVERTGFADYQISLWTQDQKDKAVVTVGGEADASIRHFFRHNQVGYEMHNITWIINRFREDSKENMQTLLAELEKLPDSAQVCCSVYLTEPKPIHELAQREDVSLLWANVALPGAQAFTAVPNEEPELDLLAGLAFDYSHLMESGETDAASIRQRFIQNLELLLSEKEFLEGMGISIRDGVSFLASQQLRAFQDRAAQEEALQTDSICVRAGKEEMIFFLQEQACSGIQVDDVRMSVWSE